MLAFLNVVLLVLLVPLLAPLIAHRLRERAARHRTDRALAGIAEHERASGRPDPWRSGSRSS